jgi:hypothetical protein
MNRYLLLTYGEHAALPRPHSIFLIIDGSVFVIQSALFFAMTRTLGVEAWKRFYWVVFTLLMVDSAWGLTVRMHDHTADTPLIPPWMWLNIVTGGFHPAFNRIWALSPKPSPAGCHRHPGHVAANSY